MNRSIIKIKENPDAGTSIEIVPAGGAVWMTKSEIARLLVVYQNTISNNIRTIFKAGILKEKDAVREHKYKMQGIERIIVLKSLLHYAIGYSLGMQKFFVSTCSRGSVMIWETESNMIFEINSFFR